MQLKKAWVMAGIAVLALVASQPLFARGGSDTTTQAASTMKPITFTLFNPDIDSQWDENLSPVAKEIQRRTGVTIDVEYLVGDMDQKIALMIASEDYPDFVAAKDRASMFIEAGAFLDLTSSIEKDGANVKKLYGENLKRLRYSLADRAIYFLGCFPVNEQRWAPQCGFQLQHAVVKELGYPRIRTIEDFGNAIKAYKAKHPTIDGQPTIGLTQCAEDWRIIISVLDPAAAATGKFGDDGEWYVDQKTLAATYHHTRPEEKVYYRWLNGLYNSGVLDPESYVQKFDQYQAKIASGRVLALTDAYWEYSDLNTVLIQDGKPERAYGMYPVTVSETIPYRDGTYYGGGYSGGWGLAITKKCKDPRRAFQYMDWVASDEGQILNMWGIEGMHYTIVNGKRVIAPEEWNRRKTDSDYRKKTGIDVHIWPFPQQGVGSKDPSGQYYNPLTPEMDIALYTGIEKEVLAGYKVRMWGDLYPKGFPVKKYGLAYQINVPNDSEAMVLWTKLEGIVWKRVPELIMAKASEFDSLWDKYQNELVEAGVRKFENAFNELLAQRIKLWNE